jgi:hypothetical protein
MKRTLASLFLLVVGCSTGPSTPAVAPAPTPAHSDVEAVNEHYVAAIMQKIAGRETLPAEQVFTNIQWLKGVPADRFLRIMNGGYSRALGVSCTHCHVESDFSSDEKRAKKAAREMAVMHRAINTQLRAMQNLESVAQERAINCSTCHRGQVNPMAPAP